jgi:hypothetical protein
VLDDGERKKKQAVSWMGGKLDDGQGLLVCGSRCAARLRRGVFGGAVGASKGRAAVLQMFLTEYLVKLLQSLPLSDEERRTGHPLQNFLFGDSLGALRRRILRIRLESGDFTALKSSFLRLLD